MTLDKMQTTYDREALKEKTRRLPGWVHFGAGNIFRAFPAAMLETLLENKKYDRGVIVAETYDYEIIEKVYKPYDNKALLVTLKSDGTATKKLIGGITESLCASREVGYSKDWRRLETIFKAKSLKLVTFTITEKGYVVPPFDIENPAEGSSALAKLTSLLLVRFLHGAYPITLQSLDNCSQNGDKLKSGVLSIAESLVEKALAPEEFLLYLKDNSKVSFPWSMIDKITPRPDVRVKEMLEKDGFTDTEIIETKKHSFVAPFVNAEETEYLVMEKPGTNFRTFLNHAGAIYTDRATVAKVERMKVTTCLNPLHTALAIAGCLLGYTLISEEMKDDDLANMIKILGYKEAMPVVTNPGIMDPDEFLSSVLTKRLPNPFMPDSPQRIATDTSSKLAIRFGETIKAYIAGGMDLESLNVIPLVLAMYSRYLTGIDDNLEQFDISPDPRLVELKLIIDKLKIGCEEQDYSCLKELYSREDIFGLDLTMTDLYHKIESYAKALFAGKGQIRIALQNIARMC